MARLISIKDAKSIINRHIEYLEQVKSVTGNKRIYSNKIEYAVNRLISNETESVLRDTPIEEINRNRNGFRIKGLRECGFFSIWDLYTSSVGLISAAKGISDEGAIAIKQIVNEIVNQTKNNIRIRLNVDNKTLFATDLVVAITQLRQIIPLTEQAGQIMDLWENDIRRSLERIKPATSFIKWFFISDEEKNSIYQEYEYLEKLFQGEYKERVQDLLYSQNLVRLLSEEEAWNDFEKNSIQFYTLLEELIPGVVISEDIVQGLPEELAKSIEKQVCKLDGLKCTLRRYQEWGVKYILHQGRVLLGDEMGLGKTIQAIAAMVSHRNDGATHHMVVCPASVLTNWCREIEKHSDLHAILIHGIDRDEKLDDWIKNGGVAVTNYETTAHIKLSNDFHFGICVVDEAHYIKNPQANRTVNVRRICASAKNVLFMTGTALENRVDEMIFLIEMLQPTIAVNVKNIAYMSASEQFREQIAPVYFRRKREDVLTELPDLVEAQEWCVLSEKEKRKYEATLFESNFQAVRRLSWNVDNIQDSVKVKRMLEIINEAKEEGRKVIVFSFFLETIRRICGLLEDQCLPPITGAVSPNRRQEILDDFENSPAGTVLVGQILSGGTGLNIQTASVVVICEPQFKPSIENQAISRAYRMGQTRNVLVYRLLCVDTIDERITELLQHKQMIFDSFADKSVVHESVEKIEIDEKTFIQIVEEEKDKVKNRELAH